MSREHNLLSRKISLWLRNLGLDMLHQHVCQTICLAIIDSGIGTGTFDLQTMAVETQVEKDELETICRTLERHNLILIDRATCEFFFRPWFRFNRKFERLSVVIARQDFNRIASRTIKTAIKEASAGIVDFTQPATKPK